MAVLGFELRRLLDCGSPRCSRSFNLHANRGWILFIPALLLLSLAGCGINEDPVPQATATRAPFEATLEVLLTRTPVLETATPSAPLVDLALPEEEVGVEPIPVRAGFPFSVTATLLNRGTSPAVDVPLMVHISAEQEEIGYSPYLQVLTTTLPASQSLSVEIPVNWNFSGGEHQLWVQANRLPEAWQPQAPTHPEWDISDNIAVLELMVEPFDAYASDLCPGRVDLEIKPEDVLPEPDRQRVMVRLHNQGNRAVYNLPVVITGEDLIGIAYTPAIPPCGGTAQLFVKVERPFKEGEALSVQVNPSEWPGALEEDKSDNNKVTVTAGFAPGVVVPPGSGLEEYDFTISTTDIETPELWLLLVTVRNLGTRDAAMVPVRVENEAGRTVADSFPLVRGEGLGIAAIRVGYLWTPGGTLTVTINPEDAEGAFPETNRENNIAPFTLP
jgi:hypothetical protein